MTFQEKLAKYADLILSVGLNLKRGENIQIKFDSHNLELVRLIVKRAYQMGASHIVYDFQDDEMNLARYHDVHDDYLDEFPSVVADFKLNLYKEGFLQLSLVSPHTNLLQEVESDRVGRINKARSQAMQATMRYGMENHTKWVVAAAASRDWAKAVFETLPEEEALSLLWENIFIATRVTMEHPKEAWIQHDAHLKQYQAYLNQKRYSKLHFVSKQTDLTVGLTRGHVWNGGSDKTISGEVFMSNMPVEEVWTMPNAFEVNGYVTMTKPLNIFGRIVKTLKLVFKDGEVVEYESDQPDIIKSLLESDSGAKRLGEVALVSIDSPIEKTGVLFKNTLFDENAASHLALGQAYIDNIEDGNIMSLEERKERGMNHSSIHQDFMIGNKEMVVYGVTNVGEEEPIMIKGQWVI
ncbi:aminopeptidase [Paenibacillus segetis]|uniref:Aminopeptidase n=1 Tax=Paenibacillus segetis TaxID=1325360 RepID=A0ABQ1YTF2_9BACL|nr:aminopeptidase [Paenibacillus segetis]GGH35540.1 aminopeptidase [Paenibacillus segetis]